MGLYAVILARPIVAGELDTYMTCVRATTPAAAIEEARTEVATEDGERNTGIYRCIACLRGDHDDLTPPEYR